MVALKNYIVPLHPNIGIAFSSVHVVLYAFPKDLSKIAVMRSC